IKRTIDTVPRGQLAQIVSAKKIFDVLFASIALAILSPVILLAALLIKLESRGPVFFKQERIGLNRRRGDRRRICRETGIDRRMCQDRRKNINAGRPFMIYKLRTMREDAEQFGPELACENDSRVTRVGRFMRKTRLDEVPQFINVIKSEMSIIGPRPERSFFINRIKQGVPEFTARLVVKPGITGLAQVEDGYTRTVDRMRDKLLYDLRYISRLSILQEVEILFKTVYVVLTGKGAF
ncbi:MAG: sugar transferase, partial [Candidatus Krumholzibacteria bacterium]|nr:sugar transferase [Candidatus Krumholzibacteria bacterium]